MKPPNTYRWQQDRIQQRLKIIEETLLEIDGRKMKFELVTYLAKYLADAISTAERKTLEEMKGLGIKISPVKTCRASSLLKSKTYRPRLDMWLRRYSNRNAEDGAEIAELRFKLLRLSNKHSIILDELRSLQEMHSRKADTYIATTERNDGMTIAQMVIHHFSEFCEIHEGALVEPSPGRPVIVPSNLFSAYLKWKSSLY